jgi:hypothetical protein
LLNVLRPFFTQQDGRMTSEQSKITDLLRVIQAEYREMPGLHLTKPQIQRLWQLEPHLCDALVDALVAADFLAKTPRNAYVLAASSLVRREIRG